MKNENLSTLPPFIDLKLLALVVLISLPIPVVSYLTSVGIQSRIESTYEKAFIEAVQKEEDVDLRLHPELMSDFSLRSRCADYKETSSYVRQLCTTKSEVSNLSVFAMLTLGLTGFVIIGIFLCSLLGRVNRFLLLASFRIGLWFSQISVAVLVLLNAGLAIATIYWTESWFIGRVHFALIGFMGLIAGLTALRIIIGSFKFAHKAQASVFGKRLGRVDYPQLWNFIETIAKESQTSPPDHIVAGLEPSFFVTEAQVTCLDGTLKGRTLFLSLPFCRVLSRKELCAIIGHEFGHFVGMDTTYSRWFFPVYRGAADTVRLIASQMGNENNGLNSIAFVPPLLVMNLFLSSFARLENKISRDRELAADKQGSLIAGTSNMVSSLVKVHGYSKIWEFTQEEMKSALEKGEMLNNASAHFAAITMLLPDNVLKDGLEKAHPFHPTDSHPSIAIRLQALGSKLSEVLCATLEKTDVTDRAINLIDHFETLEIELSEIESYKLIRSGIVQLNASESDTKLETA